MSHSINIIFILPINKRHCELHVFVEFFSWIYHKRCESLWLKKYVCWVNLWKRLPISLEWTYRIYPWNPDELDKFHVRRKYRHRTDFGARRQDAAFLWHEELSLRPACGFTESTINARATRVLSTANVRTTHRLYVSHRVITLLRFFLFFASSLALRTTHLTRACCARDKCVVRTYSTLFQFNCATCVRNSREPYWISTCSALTTHVVRTDFCSTKTLSVFFRKFGGSFLH